MGVGGSQIHVFWGPKEGLNTPFPLQCGDAMLDDYGISGCLAFTVALLDITV